MKIIEIVAAAKAANPKAFGNVPDARAVGIVAAALGEIGSKLDATAEGPLQVVRFGRFVVKRVQPKADPKAAPVRRVVFHRPKAEAGKKSVTAKR